MCDRLWRKRSSHYKGTIIGGLFNCGVVALANGWKIGLVATLIYLPVIPFFAWCDGKSWFQVDAR